MVKKEITLLFSVLCAVSMFVFASEERVRVRAMLTGYGAEQLESVLDSIEYSEGEKIKKLTVLWERGFSLDQYYLDFYEVYSHKIVPLSFAIRRKNINVVSFLLDKKVRVNNRDFSNYSPLDYAAYGGNYEIILKLLCAGASIQLVNGDGDTVLSSYIQAGHGDIRILEWLCSEKLNITGFESKQELFETGYKTPLGVACIHGNVSAFCALYSMGSDPARICVGRNKNNGSFEYINAEALAREGRQRNQGYHDNIVCYYGIERQGDSGPAYCHYSKVNDSYQQILNHLGQPKKFTTAEQIKRLRVVIPRLGLNGEVISP